VVLEGVVVGELGVALGDASVALDAQSTHTDARGRFRLEFFKPPETESWVLVEKVGYALKGFPEVFRSGAITTVRYEL
jgi:hypothetical protein